MNKQLNGKYTGIIRGNEKDRQQLNPQRAYKKAVKRKRDQEVVYAKEEVSSRRSMSNGSKQFMIEEYAKNNNVTITQAMIHFMD